MADRVFAKVLPFKSVAGTLNSSLTLDLPLKTKQYFLLIRHKDQTAVYGRKVNHFEVEKRGKVDKSHFTNIGVSHYNNLQCSEEKKMVNLTTNMRQVDPG